MSIQINHPTNPAPEGSQTWTTDEMQQDFDVTGFAMGMVVVTRKTDGAKGTLEFNGSPRVYHSFQVGT